MAKTKKCKTCGDTKPLTDFYKLDRARDGRFGECKVCTIRRARANYWDNRDRYVRYERQRSQTPDRKAKAAEYQRRMRAANPEKHRVRAKVQYALRSGKLVRQPCEVCGTTERVQAHHDDYSKPLEVRWLCFKHHREIHGQMVTPT